MIEENSGSENDFVAFLPPNFLSSLVPSRILFLWDCGFVLSTLWYPRQLECDAAARAAQFKLRRARCAAASCWDWHRSQRPGPAAVSLAGIMPAGNLGA